MKAVLLLALAAVALGSCEANAQTAATRLSVSQASIPAFIYVQPMGPGLDAQDLESVMRGIRGFYGSAVKLLPEQPLPKAAYYPPRRRYRADEILTYLDGRLPADGLRIIGVTAEDISTTKGRVRDWGILGLGAMPGKSCVISRFRCQKTARSVAHVRERLTKVAVHELGHTFGLDHCASRGCIMEDAGGKVATADREQDFCPACRARLQRLKTTLTEPPRIPWSRRAQ